MPDSAETLKILAESLVNTNQIDFGSDFNPDSPRYTINEGGNSGIFEVNADGSAGYTYKLEVPAGRAGMQPELSLDYNSHSGDGILGVGWNLKGLSRITRCNKTIASDGESKAIQFDDTDRFCLDGDYLIKINVTSDFTEYRPEHDPTTAVFSMGSDETGGPFRFTVYKKNGRILHYGAEGARILKNRQKWTASTYDRGSAQLDTSQRVCFGWLLYEVIDRNGNGMYIDYSEYYEGFYRQGGEKLPVAIRYTFRSSDPLVPSEDNRHPTLRSVRFFYGKRPDDIGLNARNTTFVSGISFDNSNILTRIEMWAPNPIINSYNENLIRSYYLTYNHDNLPYLNPVSTFDDFLNYTISGRSLLVSIKECDAHGVCKIPTCFEYEHGDIPFKNIDTGITGLDSSDPSHWGMIIADINGDGRDDLLYRRNTGTSPHGWIELTWYYRLSNGDGFGPEMATNLPIQYAIPTGRIRASNLIPADIDGDGKVEVAFPMNYNYYPGKPDFWRYFKLIEVSPDKMLFKSIENPNDAPDSVSSYDIAEQSGCYKGSCTAPSGGGKFFFADMNGDGLPEILHNYSPNPSTLLLQIDINNGKGLWGFWGLRRNKNGILASSLEIMSDNPSGDPDERGTPAYYFFGDARLFAPLSSYIANSNGSGQESLLFPSLVSLDKYNPGHLVGSSGYRYRSATISALTGKVSMEDTTLLLSDVNVNRGEDKYVTENFYYFFIDLNGDGIADALKFKRDGGYPEIIWNTGNGFSEPSIGVQQNSTFNHPAFEFGPRLQEGSFTIMDIDQDGRPELLLIGRNHKACDELGVAKDMISYKLKYNKTDSKYYLELDLRPLLSTTHSSSSFTAIPAHDFSSAELAFTHILDVDGNGLMDILTLDKNSDGTKSIHLYKKEGKKADLLKGIREGSGVLIGISYEPLVGRSDKDMPCVYPSYCVARGLWVVSEYYLDRGGDWSSGSKTYKISYFGHRFDMYGRGFLGFSRRIIKDMRYGLSWTTDYDNITRIGTSYPNACLPQSEYFQANLNSGILSKDARTTYEIHPQNGPKEGKPFSVVPKEIIQSESGEPGIIMRNIKVTLDYDQFDNLKHREVSALTEGSVHIWDATYDYSQVQNWLLTLITSVTEKSTSATGKSQTRTRQYIPNYTTGLIDKIIIEPANNNRDLYLETTFDHNSDGLAKTITSRDWFGVSRKSSFTYDRREGITVETISHHLDDNPILDKSNKLTTSFIYHPAFAVLVWRQDPDGVITKWKYDRFGRIRAKIASDGANLTINYLRDPYSQYVYIVNLVQDGHGQVNTFFDQFGRQLSIEQTVFDGRMSRIDTRYNDYLPDKVDFISKPYFLTDSEIKVDTHMDYDIIGRLLNIEHTKDKRIHYEYEYRSLKTTVYTVFDDGVTKKKEKTNYIVKDELDRIIKSVDILYDGLLEHEIPTSYSYGPFGQLENIIDSKGNKTIIEYDEIGRRTRLVDPDTGETILKYNGFGEIRQETNSDNKTTDYIYDKLGRLVTSKINGDVTGFNWGTSAIHTPIGWIATTSANGKISSTVSEDGIQKFFEYNSNGGLYKTTWNIGVYGTFDIKMEYDSFGRPSVLRYPTIGLASSLVLKYIYTSVSGILEKIIDNDTGYVYWQANNIDADGLLQQETLGNNTVTTTRQYDDTSKDLNKIKTVHNSTGKTIQDLSYTYYADGKLSGQKNALAPSPSNLEEKFEYDNLSRLKTWYAPGFNWSFRYEYDEIGNLRLKTASSSTTNQEIRTIYTPDGINAGPHAINRTSYGDFVYDKIGNQRQGSENRAIEYTSNNLPKHLVQKDISIDFKYDAEGNRVLKKTLGETVVYINGLYEKRISGGNTTHVFYISSPQRIVAQIMIEEKNGTFAKKIYYIHDDHLGSSHTISNELGEINQTMRFDPFGNLLDPTDPMKPAIPSPSSSSAIHLGFTGHEHDFEVSLINMKGRIYDPKLQRFITADPFVSSIYSSQALNRYSYVLNNPVNLVDPSGYMPEGGGAGTGGGSSPSGPGGGPTGQSLADIQAAVYTNFLNGVHESFFNRNWINDAERRAGRILKKVGTVTESVLLTTSPIIAATQQYFESKASGSQTNIAIGDAVLAGFKPLPFYDAGENLYNIDLALHRRDFRDALGQSLRFNFNFGKDWALTVSSFIGAVGIDKGLTINPSSKVGSLTGGPLNPAGQTIGEKAFETALKLGFTPERGKAVFYTGLGEGVNTPQIITLSKSLQLGDPLAKTWGGAYLNALERNGVTLPRDVWTRASAEFAREAVKSGSSISLLRGGIVKTGTTWLEAERPVIQSAFMPYIVHFFVIK